MVKHFTTGMVLIEWRSGVGPSLFLPQCLTTMLSPVTTTPLSFCNTNIQYILLQLLTSHHSVLRMSDAHRYEYASKFIVMSNVYHSSKKDSTLP